jgi:hypothetical protein
MLGALSEYHAISTSIAIEELDLCALPCAVRRTILLIILAIIIKNWLNILAIQIKKPPKRLGVCC